MRRIVLLALAAGAVIGSGCSQAPGSGASASAPGKPPSAGSGGTGWDPIGCTALPGTPAEIAQTPRAQPNTELLALALSSGVTAEQGIYDRLVADLAAIRALEPAAPSRYQPAFDGKQLLLGADSATLDAMASGAYTAWQCLNDYYGYESFAKGGGSPPYGVLGLKGIYDLRQLADLYAQLPDVGYAQPDYQVGDGAGIYVTPEGGAWHYVADAASGDCAAGCTDHHLYYFISDGAGSVRYIAQWTNPNDPSAPAWVTDYWVNAASRAPPAP